MAHRGGTNIDRDVWLAAQTHAVFSHSRAWRLRSITFSIIPCLAADVIHLVSNSVCFKYSYGFSRLPHVYTCFHQFPYVLAYANTHIYIYMYIYIYIYTSLCIYIYIYSPILGQVGPILNHIWARTGPICGSMLGPCWAHTKHGPTSRLNSLTLMASITGPIDMGPSRAQLGPILGHVLEPMWAHLWPMLGPYWAHIEHTAAHAAPHAAPHERLLLRMPLLISLCMLLTCGSEPQHNCRPANATGARPQAFVSLMRRFQP